MKQYRKHIASKAATRARFASPLFTPNILFRLRVASQRISLRLTDPLSASPLGRVSWQLRQPAPEDTAGAWQSDEGAEQVGCRLGVRRPGAAG